MSNDYTYRLIGVHERAWSEGKPWLVQILNNGKHVAYRSFDTKGEAERYIRARSATTSYLDSEQK